MTIASGSKGNAYVISSGRSQLLIECGINFDKIRKALNFDLSAVEGCLISHEHGDHVAGVKKCYAHRALRYTRRKAPYLL
ncbi:MBL fold metallo-hydrolase [Listeria monocytogenes]|uniref:MBL fold metallo-hydrolase n=1 Tax=Listeria monocytogenes TaxID=1639 RepID=UPI001FB5B2CB|nr:MBL fold metallo-hydrolase [Listeria monocytogenes]